MPDPKRLANLDFDKVYQIKNLAGLTLSGTGWMPFIKNATSSSAFNPITSVTSATPRLVLDFEDLTTMWRDTGAVTPVSGLGHDIQRIDNKVVGGGYFSQNIEARAPTYAAFGTQRGALFTKTATQALVSSLAASAWKFMTDGTAWTVVARYMPTTNHSGMLFTSAGTGSANTGAWWYQQANKIYPAIHKGGGGTVVGFASTATITNGVPVTVTFTYQYGRSGNDGQLRWNGSADNSQESLNAPSSSNPGYALGIGGSFHSDPPSYTLDGAIRRLCIYEGLLTGADLTGVETWVEADVFDSNESLNGNLNCNGKTLYNGRLRYTSVTAAYSPLLTDEVLLCNGTFTVTLPTASGIGGKVYQIKNVGTGLVTVDGNASETIDGSLTVVVAAGNNLYIMSDGTNWVIL